MERDSWIKLCSRVFLLAGIANMLANFAGFLFGGVLIAASAVFLAKRYRPVVAVLGPISMAIATFIGIRTVVSLLYPTPILYTPGGLFFGPAATLLMSPSPIFTFILSGPIIPIVSYSEAMSMVDLAFNLAAVLLNFLGLGFLVWGWPGLILADSETTNSIVTGATSLIPQR